MAREVSPQLGGAGSILADRYVLGEMLARGGSGVVHSARDLQSGEQVAIKLLHPQRLRWHSARERLKREAEATSALSHPHIVRVLDLTEDQHGVPFLVLELLRGASLHDVLETRGSFSAQAALELLLPIVGAMALAHARGILHRDLTPANVFLSEAASGGALQPKLLDFGIAWRSDSEALTQPGRRVGTLGFMAPEQAQAGERSPATDVWALARLFMACVAPSAAEPEPRTHCPALAPVLERALAHEPAARFRDAAAFARALLEQARVSALHIPADPDPVGLPDWTAWCAHDAAVTQDQPRHVAAAVSGSPAPRIGDTLLGRFELLRVLGAGGTGTVFEALDRASAGRVALKLLHGSDPTTLYRAKHEFRSLCENVHPNLATMHELFVSEPRPFFTMELIDGEPFNAFVRTGEGPRLYDEARLRDCLEQLAHGILHLHALGKLHADLKPSNVLVTATGRLAIVDFGLFASWNDREPLERGLFGTAEYAAPEQANATQLAPACDWYAVGVMLYEALTGERPFAGAADAIMREKQQRLPKAPRESCAAIAPELEAVCLRLLAIDPSARATGHDLLIALALPDAFQRVPEARLFGRELELSRLDASVTRAAAANLGALFVTGAAGIGKTLLLDHFATRLREQQRALVLTGRCRAHEALHYKAFDGVVDALSTQLLQLPAAEVRALLPEGTPALAQLFPVLSRVPVVASLPLTAATTATAIDEAVLRKRAVNALRELLAALAQREPVVLCIDDLHWGDLDSAWLMRELLEPPTPGLLIVATYRGDNADSSPMLRELLGQGPPTFMSEQLVLGPLAAADVSELAASLLPQPRAALADVIARAAQGHPLLAHELVRFVERTGGASLPELRSAQAAVSARLQELSRPARALLEVICLAGRALPHSLALEVALVHDVTAVHELLLARAVRELPQERELCLEPYHEPVREVVVAELAPLRRRAIHLQLAEHLLQRGSSMLEATVQQYLLAGRTEQAAALAERAARSATQALAFHAASDLLELALRFARDATESLRLRVELADAYVRQGRSFAAAQTYQVAAAALPTSERARELTLRAMTQYLVSGRLNAGIALFGPLAAELGLPFDPQGARKVEAIVRRFPRAFHWFSVITGRLWLWWFALTRRPRLRARRVDEPTHDLAAARMRLLWSATPMLWQLEGTLAAYLSQHVSRWARRLGHATIYSQTLSLQLTTVAYVVAKPNRTIARGMQRLQRLVDEHGDFWDREFVRVMDAAHSLFAGDRVRAITASRPAAVALSARTPIGVATQSLARVITLPSLFWLGRMGELSALCEAWASEASACGDRHVEASCLVFQAYRHLREDDVAAALAALARARSVDIDYQHPVLTDPWWASNVALYADDAASALAFCSDTRLSQLPRTLATPGAVGFWALASGTSAAALAIQTPARRSEALTRLAHEITLAKRAFLAPAHGVIAQLEATHAVLTDRTQPVDALLERAAKHYDALGWKLHAASMQLARAQRTTSHHASLEQRALAVIAAEGIANPWRWAEMLAPALVRAPRRSSG